jgi:isoleucyl-tRNA synthetase
LPWKTGEAPSHYDVYEFHPVVAMLQVFCSEDLGAFYLDVLKDRLYTTAPKSHGRRSAQTALWHITHAMVRWMAPFLSFTAEEAWKVMSPGASSIFAETYWKLADDTMLWGSAEDAAEARTRWAAARNLRDHVNRVIEEQRAAGVIGSSLQAEVTIRANAEQKSILDALGDELKYVLIVSKATLDLDPGADTADATARAASAPKCERCWHYRDDVGNDPARPELCGRCTDDADLCGGQSRRVA